MRRLRTPDAGDGGHLHAPVPSPAETWFLATHLMATHSNGIPALQAQARPGTGSCNAAWLMLRKLRRATASPDRTLPQGIAEVDEASVRRRSETAAKEAPEKKAGGRSGEGKILLAGAVELSERGGPRRIRLKETDSYGGDGLRSFIAGTVEPGARAVTDGWSGQSGLPENPRGARVAGDRRAHGILKWTHRVFSNLKRWAMGVLHGLRRKRFQRYLDESVFRCSRRRHRRRSSGTLLGIGLRLKPATCRDFVDGRA